MSLSNSELDDHNDVDELEVETVDLLEHNRWDKSIANALQISSEIAKHNR